MVAFLSYIPYLTLFERFVGRPLAVIDTGHPYSDLLASVVLLVSGGLLFMLVVVHTYVFVENSLRYLYSTASTVLDSRRREG